MVVLNRIYTRTGDRGETALGDGSRYGVRIHYSDEGPEPLETGGGIVRALPLRGTGPFVVLNGDVWTDADLGPRADISLERLGHMKPYFDRKCGTVTIGNACPITDGAVAVLVMHRDAARRLGYEPLGTLRG